MDKQQTLFWGDFGVHLETYIHGYPPLCVLDLLYAKASPILALSVFMIHV